MLPRVAEQLHIESSSREGWLTGLSEQLLAHAKQEQIEFAVCFPTLDVDILEHRRINTTFDNETTFMAFPFREDVHKAEIYDKSLEDRFRQIFDEFQPDVIHLFGTEFPHTLAATLVAPNPERVMIGIQGLCFVYARAYPADIPLKVWNRTTFRDFIKRDNLRKQRTKFLERGKNEIEAIRNVGHVTGRTIWDQCYMQEWNEKAKYHFMNETLRPTFYDGAWSAENCQKGCIFVSQGDYPIKGLHYLLKAMPRILKHHPEAEVYVAGNSIVKTALEHGLDGLKGKLKLDSYGKYIVELLKENNLVEKVHFVGNQDAEGMKRYYLKANVFVCPSAMENSPNSLGEAMLLGIPIVASKVGGIPTMLKDCVEGFLYECNDVDALALYVSVILDGGEKVSQMCANARLHARETHDGKKNFARLIQIYREINKE